ncbi:MAG: tetratricopeptide repeat protein [Holophagales bacterium]|nr:tetratricopeptide repeat protein [Holophagales bacterium]
MDLSPRTRAPIRSGSRRSRWSTGRSRGDRLPPFELWRRRAPLPWRLASLLLFPIHLAGHAINASLPGPFPVSGFDFVHIGLVAAVAGAAAASAGTSPWPPLDAERLRSRPVLAVAILLGTAALQIALAREPGLLWTGLPLAALALFAMRARREPSVPAHALPPARAVAVFAVVLALALALRVPSARRSREFETLIRLGAERLVAGRVDAARPSLEAALELRPGHSEVLWLLGWADLQKGNRVAARRHLEASLSKRPGSVEAARLLAILDRQEGRGATSKPVP